MLLLKCTLCCLKLRLERLFFLGGGLELIELSEQYLCDLEEALHVFLLLGDLFESQLQLLF